MTITASQYKRIGTFGSCHSQTLDQELLYMIVNGLAEARIDHLSFTGKAVLFAALTDEGKVALKEYKRKHKVGDP